MCYTCINIIVIYNNDKLYIIMNKRMLSNTVLYTASTV